MLKVDGLVPFGIVSLSTHGIVSFPWVLAHPVRLWRHGENAPLKIVWVGVDGCELEALNETRAPALHAHPVMLTRAGFEGETARLRGQEFGISGYGFWRWCGWGQMDAGGTGGIE